MATIYDAFGLELSQEARQPKGRLRDVECFDEITDRISSAPKVGAEETRASELPAAGARIAYQSPDAIGRSAAGELLEGTSFEERTETA
jgi:hypothetical protein